VATNYGFNIGGGGISDLVKPIDVKPVRGMSFAPVSLPRTREKDSKKAIQGALLGAISPLLGEAAVRGLGKLPGLEGLLYQKDPAVLEELGVKEPTLGLGDDSRFRRRTLESMAGRKLTEDEYEALENNKVLEQLKLGDIERKPLNPFEEEAKKRRKLVEQALPAGNVPRQKTLLGRALTEGLTYAPLGLLDDDAIAAGITTAGATRKAQSAIENANLENYLARQTKRGEKLVDVGDFTRGIGNGVVIRPDDDKVRTVRREFLVSPDKRTQYIMSKGDPAVDFEHGPLGPVPVPEGQHYVREDFTLDPKDLPKDEPIKLLVTTAADAKNSTGVTKYSLDREGNPRATIYVVDHLDNGKLKTLPEMNEEYGDIWHTPQPGFAYEAQTFRARPIQSQIDWMERRDLKQGSLQASLRPLETLGELALEAIGMGETPEKQSELFADTGALAGFAVDLKRNVDAFGRLVGESIGMSPLSALRGSLDKGEEETYALQFLDAQQKFANALESGDQTAIDDTRQKFRSAARQFRDNVERQGGDVGVLSLIADADRSRFDEIAVKRSRIISAQLRLAYMSAAQDGSTGVALSDKDVANYLVRVGFGSNNPNEVLDKVATVFEEQVGDFDADSTPRTLFINSRGTSPANIREMDDYIRTYGVSQTQLNSARDMSKSKEERQAIANQIIDAMNSRTDGRASIHFNYNPETGRIILNDVQKILENQLSPSYTFFLEKILPQTKGYGMDVILKLKEKELTGQVGQTPSVKSVYGDDEKRAAF